MEFLQKHVQKHGWIIDFVAMAFLLFIGGIAIAIYLVPPKYFLMALTVILLLSIIIPFMVYRYDESGVRESLIIATLTGVICKLLSILKRPRKT